MRSALLFAAFAVLFLLGVLTPMPARASRHATAPAAIRIESHTPAKVGQRLRLVATLTAQDGVPISNQTLLLFVEGELLERRLTDSSGSAVFMMPDSLAAGTYSVRVVFRGWREHGPAQAQIDLLVEPSELQVEVLPPLQGVQFDLGGREFRSGPDGIARIQVDQPGAFELELLPLEPELDGRRVIFAGWESGSAQLTRTVVMAGDQSLQAGYEILYRVDFSFQDPLGDAVASERVTSLEIKSSNGRYLILDAQQPVWLQANVIFERLSGLDSVALVHAVQQVLVDGSNVVNRGQQRFIIQQQGDVAVDLLMYDTVFTAHDPLFSYPIGDGVALTFPDGSQRYYPFDGAGRVVLPDLARGSYQARLLGEPGLTLDVPVVLSRDQVVRLPALTLMDLLALFSLLFISMLGLFLAGRVKYLARK